VGEREVSVEHLGWGRGRGRGRGRVQVRGT